MLFLLSLFPLLLPFVSSWKSGETPPSSADCIWKYIEQPLSHYARGVNSMTYQQRLCIYDQYWQPHQGLPVFFYTGNVYTSILSLLIILILIIYCHPLSLLILRKALWMSMSTTLDSCGNLQRLKKH